MLYAASPTFSGWRAPNELLIGCLGGIRSRERSIASASPRLNGSRGHGLAERGVRDSRAAETVVSVVEPDVLPRSDRALRDGELDFDPGAAGAPDRARYVGLAIARLRRTRERATRMPLRRRFDPVHGGGVQPVLHEQRMIATLHDDERIVVGAFGGDIPRGVAEVFPAAEMQAVTLSERIERETAMGAEQLAVGRADRARRGRQVTTQEIRERPLADEANAGALLLAGHRDSRGSGKRADFGFEKVAERKDHVREILATHGVQEVALVLAPIAPLEQAW